MVDLSLWTPAKNTLKTWIEYTPGTIKSTIIPFQDNVKETISINSDGFNWQNLDQQLETILHSSHRKTGICNALEKGISLIDTTKFNCVILLTDGKEEVRSISELCILIENFCGKHSDYAHIFYVQLGSQQVDNQVMNAINSCDDITIINGGDNIPLIPQLLTKEIIINTHNLPEEFDIEVLEPREFCAATENLNTVCRHLKFEIVEGKFINGKARIRISNGYSDLSTLISKIKDEEVQGEVTIKSQNVYERFKEQSLIVNIINKPETVLTIVDIPENGDINIGECSYYKSFLFFSGSRPARLSYKFNYAFNEPARTKNAEAKFRVKLANCQENEYEVLFNGEKCEGGIITINSSNCDGGQVEIIFNDNVTAGKKTVSIELIQASNLDRINNYSVANAQPHFVFNLSGKVTEEWSIWKTIFVWLGIIVVGALILWFIFLKRILFPTISKINYIQITSPYFANVKVKGARKVVLSAKSKPQSAINRVFTGKIVYNNNPCWTSPMELVPAKNGIRVKPNKCYSMNTALLTRQREYNWTNSANNQKIIIKIN